MTKYTIGYDFGTESARALLLNLDLSKIECVLEESYQHGVITKEFGHQMLDEYMVLQHPLDYLKVMQSLTKEILAKSGVSKEAVVGIGIDFTSCTCLPITDDFQPLMTMPKYEEEPHAYVKLWKSHSAERYAQQMTQLLKGSDVIAKYGGVISSEWLYPKFLEWVNEAPHLLDDTAYFVEAVDWLTMLLTGNVVRSACAAGFKGLNEKEGMQLSDAQLEAFQPNLSQYAEKYLKGNISEVGKRAGTLTDEYAQFLGLSEKTTVGVGIIDAHSAVIGAGINTPNELVIVVGTSSCHLLMSEKEVFIPGISGVVKDGILPQYYAYEAGQVAVGDIFASFVKEHVKADYWKEAAQKNESIYDVLNNYACKLMPGESGLIALDWHNGNRTPYVNPHLSGVIVGETLHTKAYEKYRAYLEATAFGTKNIIERFEQQGVPINRIVLTGGIPNKNIFLTQLYADILQRDIEVVIEQQIPALGAAIIGAASFYADDSSITLAQLVDRYGSKQRHVYTPNDAYGEIYEHLYNLYKELIHLFGEATNIMESLNLRNSELKVKGGDI